MTIQRENGKIGITLPEGVDIDLLQRLVDFIKYNEYTCASKASQEDINTLSSDINKSWWSENKDRLLGA